MGGGDAESTSWTRTRSPTTSYENCRQRGRFPPPAPAKVHQRNRFRWCSPSPYQTDSSHSVRNLTVL